jgi:hypothetical protein
LFNILSNGIKYTEEGYVKLRITAQQHDNATDITFSIEDTGIGLSEQQIANIFADPDSKKGMPLTKKMADAIGATIDIHSQPGQGSTFSVTLPGVSTAKASDSASAKDTSHHSETKANSIRRKNSDAMREYISVLKDKLMPQYHEMEQQISFEALESFVAQFREQSEHYKIEKGIELADELATDIRNYDIPNITRNIRKIEAYIQTNIRDLQGE